MRVITTPDLPSLLDDAEWAALSLVLGARQNDSSALAAARVGIMRLNLRLCTSGVFTFGWKELPADAGIGYRNANKRVTAWMKSGKWWQFWDALMALRAGPYVPPSDSGYRGKDPIAALLAELHRAYRFFNWRFTGNTLPAAIAITLERRQKGRSLLGYHSLAALPTPVGCKPHIALLPEYLASVDASMNCLLHEMAHLRNFQLGIQDTNTRTQYHTLDFKVSAELFGLKCKGRDVSSGYYETIIGPRAREAIGILNPPSSLFAFTLSSATTVAPPR